MSVYTYMIGNTYCLMFNHSAYTWWFTTDYSFLLNASKYVIQYV